MARTLSRVRIQGELHTVADAKRDVRLQRTLADVWQGKRGDDNECMNATAILHNAGAFPHDVLAVSVTKSRAYVVDRPGRCVRYVLDEAAGAAIDDHDDAGIAEAGELVLHKPRGQQVKGSQHGTASGSKTKNGARTPRTIGSVGARRRELVAVGALRA